MRNFTFTALILFTPGRAAAASAADAPQVIMPSENKPAVATAPVTTQDFPQLEEVPLSSKPAEAVEPPAPAKPVQAVKSAAAPAAPVKRAEEAPLPVKPAVAVKPAAAPEIKKPAERKKKVLPSTPIPQPEPKPEGGFTVTKTHKVTEGDTLWDLSAKYYQDPFKWGRIYNANLNVVSNPDLINPKDELIIPEITESVRPETQKTVVAGEGDTVKDAELFSSEVAQPEAAEAAPVEPPAPAKTAAAEASDALAGFDREYMSEDMPEHQKEWDSGVKVVPDGWREDGVISAKEKGDGDGMDDGLSMDGEILGISMARPGLVKKGDYLAVYMKGTDAYDKAGRRLGREVQAAGMLEVLESEGSRVRARIIDSVTPISKGYVVKKK